MVSNACNRVFLRVDFVGLLGISHAVFILYVRCLIAYLSQSLFLTGGPCLSRKYFTQDNSNFTIFIFSQIKATSRTRVL